MEEVIKTIHSSKKHVPLYKVIIISFISIISGAVITYFSLDFMRNTPEKLDPVEADLSFLDGDQPVDDMAFLDGETGYVYAEILDFNTSPEQLLTLRNNRGEVNTYHVSSQIFISKKVRENQVATASGKTDSIESGKWATVNLRRLEGQYQVTSILYQ